MKHTIYVTLLMSLFLTIASCGKDASIAQLISDAEDNPTSGDNPSPAPTPSLEYVKMSVASQTAGSLYIMFEPISEVSYYRCGRTNSWSNNRKCNGVQTIGYGYMNPNTEYSFTAIAYNENDTELGRNTQTFRTAQAPYDNYMRSCGGTSFNPVYNVQMRKETLANGHTKKILQFNGQSGYWFQVYKVYGPYESTNKNWEDGTYNISSSDCQIYYNFGTNNVSIYDGNGKVKISHSGNIYTFFVVGDDDCIMVQFAGTIS